MKRTSELLIFIGISVMVLGLLFYFSPIKSPYNDNFDIDPLRGISLTSHRDKGERVEGYFTVLGGNEEIEFTIKDPYGAIIYDAGIVKSRKDFAFTTEFEGVYSLFFENKQNSEKHVFLTTQRTFIGDGLALAIALIGVGILIFGLAGFYAERLKRAGKKVETEVTHSMKNMERE